jgi:outer membrane protein
MKNLVYIVLLVVFVGKVQAQDTLSIGEVVQKVLKNNHGLDLAKNNTLKSKNKTTAGNAGMLPKVDLSGGGNVSQTTADLTFAGDIPPIVGADGESLSYNGGLNVSYNLFDGLGSIYTLKSLKTGADLMSMQERLSIESTIYQVYTVYYQAVNMQEQLAIAENSLSLSRERYDRMKLKFDYGNVNSIDLLNAEVDLNNDSTGYLNAKYALRSLKRNLNLLMGGVDDIDYLVNTQINISVIESLSTESKVKENNLNLLIARTNISQAEYQKKINQSFIMPRLIIGGNYGFNYSETNTGIVLNQQSLGLTGSVTFAWNLFDGGKKSIQLRNAQIDIENSKIAHEQAVVSVSNDFHNAMDNYSKMKDLLSLSQKSSSVAQRNFERTKELYYQGNLSSTDFRLAQLNFNRSKSQVISSQVNLKLAELELKRLAGELIN